MKTMKNDRYTYRVTWSEDDKEYVGLCAEFPSLSWLAPSQEAALRGIRSVVAGVVADMHKTAEPIPQPLGSGFAFPRPFTATLHWRPPKQASA